MTKTGKLVFLYKLSLSLFILLIALHVIDLIPIPSNYSNESNFSGYIVAALVLTYISSIIIAIIFVNAINRDWVPWLFGLIIPFVNIVVLGRLIFIGKREIEIARKNFNAPDLKIIGASTLSAQELYDALEKQEAYCVKFQFCISCFYITFKRDSKLFYIPKDKKRIFFHWPYTVITLLFGWWGIPWGPIWSAQVLSANASGSEDLSYEVMQVLRQNYDVKYTINPETKDKIYYLSLDNGLSRKGPFQASQIQSMLASNVLKQDTLIWLPDSPDAISITAFLENHSSSTTPASA